MTQATESEAPALDREQLTASAKNAVPRMVVLAVLAVVVAWLQSPLGELGSILVTFFLALAAIFFVRCGYALLLGFVSLVSKPFRKQGNAPKAGWLIAGILLNTLEAAVCIGLALYVMQAAGWWWTEIQVPVTDDYGQPHL